MKDIFEEPELIQTRNGSSVFFSGRLLYSKYNPKKTIFTQIEKATFKSRSLVILASPVLDYGVNEILEKIDSSSFLLAIQMNEGLYNFTKKQKNEKYFDALNKQATNFLFLCLESEEKFFTLFTELDKQYDFTRLIFITSTSLPLIDKTQASFFSEIKTQVENYLKQKLVNRLTLINMGHRFAANFFKNLKHLCDTTKHNQNFQTIYDIKTSKPILILGAGPSLDASLEKIISHREKFFIIAVDAVAATLLDFFVPDAIILLESQVFITSAFTGLISSSRELPFLFADLTSAPQVLKNFNGKIFYYFTEYASANFFQRFFELNYFEKKYASVGSVGLSAIQVALNIRSNTNIPIIITGLDFSYPQTFTHSKYSFQFAKNFTQTQKFKPLFNAGYFFNDSILRFRKNGLKLFTNQAMSSYAKTFATILQLEKNIILLPSSAHNNTKSFAEVLTYINSNTHQTQIDIKISKPNKYLEYLNNYLTQTQADLELIRLCLTGKKNLDNATLIELLLKNDFLFLHFPDYSSKLGQQILEPNFLKRIRIEVEYFLKFLANTL